MLSNTSELITLANKPNLGFKRPAILLLALVFTFSFYTVDANAYTNNQSPIFLFLNSYFGLLPPSVWHNVTYMGDALVLMPLLSFFCLTNPRIWAAFFGSVPVALLLSHLGKHYFAIPRPAAVLDQHLFHIIGNPLTAHSSLPSGHTITVFTAVFVILLCRKASRPQRQRGLVHGALLLAFGTMVSLSRVAVGAHWPFDLILGAICGYFAAYSGVLLTVRFTRWWSVITSRPHLLALSVFLFPLLLTIQVLTNRTPDLFVVQIAVFISSTISILLVIKAYNAYESTH